MPDDGVFYSFEKLFDQLRDALTEGFDRIDRRLDEVNRKIDSKADIRSVVALEGKINDLELRLEGRFEKIDGRFKPLEIASASTAAVSRNQRWVANGLIILASGGVSALIYLLAGGGHP